MTVNEAGQGDPREDFTGVLARTPRAISMIAHLLDPVEAAERGIAFGMMDRQGFAASAANKLEDEASVYAEAAGEDLDALRLVAHPFMVEDELETVHLAIEAGDQPVHPVTASLYEVSKRRLHVAEDLGQFVNWRVDVTAAVGDDEERDDEADEWRETRPVSKATYQALMTVLETQDGDPFDRLRLLEVVASDMLPDLQERAFTYVAGAVLESGKVTDPHERAVSDLIVAQSLRYGHSVFVRQTMGYFNGQQLTAEVPLIITE